MELRSWNVCAADSSVVELHYENSVVRVRKTDFDRAFAAIVNASEADVRRDFAI